MDIKEKALSEHYKWRGKIEITPRAEVADAEQLSLAYTPGVAEPCLEIKKDISKSFELTRRWNTVAVVTDGTAVLGLGDIGPEAGMPVMEGKCVLFKSFAGVDAFPICIKSKDADEIVNTVYNISGGFGGINLEDISAPRCFEIEEKLRKRCDIPVFHDDQHGTAVVVSAAVTNALRVVGKRIEEVKIAISGAGAAGTAIAKLLLKIGAHNIVMSDKNGVISRDNPTGDAARDSLSEITNPKNINGKLCDAMENADIFIGVSAPGIVSKKMAASMAKDAIILSMANPVPEISPEDAREAGARIIGTGRSDYPNQINNVLAFPGIFRGALDARASDINDEMKAAAVKALSELVSESELSAEYILPKAFDRRVGVTVAEAVKKAAQSSGVARI